MNVTTGNYIKVFIPNDEVNDYENIQKKSKKESVKNVIFYTKHGPIESQVYEYHSSKNLKKNFLYKMANSYNDQIWDYYKILKPNIANSLEKIGIETRKMYKNPQQKTKMNNLKFQKKQNTNGKFIVSFD